MGTAGRSAPLRRTGSLLVLLGLELAVVVGLHWLGRFEGLRIGWAQPVPWLLSSPVEDVLGALLRTVGLVMAYWLLVSTLLYLLASLTRLPAAIRAVGWATLPLVRRVADHAVAVTLATSMVGGGTLGVASPALAAQDDTTSTTAYHPKVAGAPSDADQATSSSDEKKPTTSTTTTTTAPPTTAAPTTAAPTTAPPTTAAPTTMAPPTTKPPTTTAPPTTAAPTTTAPPTTKPPTTTAPPTTAPPTTKPPTTTAAGSKAPPPAYVPAPASRAPATEPTTTTTTTTPTTTTAPASSTTSTTGLRPPAYRFPAAGTSPAQKEGPSSGGSGGGGSTGSRQGPGEEAQPSKPKPHKVKRGENLWTIARDHLASTRGGGSGELTNREVARYWLRVLAANKHHLWSGDPNLIFPREPIILPPVD